MLAYNFSSADPSIGLSFVALCGFLASVGFSLTRWFNLDETDVQEAMQKMEKDKKSEIQSGLSDLKKEMLKDRDTRTDLYANMLVELYQSFNMEEVREALPVTLFTQLEPQIDALFEIGVKKLRESAELREKANQTGGIAAKNYENMRKETLKEVKQTLQTLEASLQNLLSHGSKAEVDQPMESGDIRAQFEQNLQRAMDLDSQMDQLISDDRSNELRERYLSNQPKNQE
jgi:hypothetical protein